MTHLQDIARIEEIMDGGPAEHVPGLLAIKSINIRQLEMTTGLLEQIAALQAALDAAHVRIRDLEARLRQPYHDARYEPA